MANKTEPPTPRRLREARRKGDVAISRDAANVLTLLVGAAVLFLFAGTVGAAFQRLMTETVALASEIGVSPLESDTSALASTRLIHETALRGALEQVPRLVLPIVLPMMAVGLLFAWLQVGNVVTTDPLVPKLSRLDPAGRLKSWFSIKGGFELAKTIGKLALVLSIGALTLWGSIATLQRLSFTTPGGLLSEGRSVARLFLWTVGLPLAALAALDLAFHRWQWRKKLMMSRDEVKREYKEQEGDPQLRSERRTLHQEILLGAGGGNVVQALAQADAVVVNPTHYAVALHYRKGQSGKAAGRAPRITAKGRDRTARRILRLARRWQVPVVRDVPLARRLFQEELGGYVPEELYEAVGEVLLFAWKVRREAGTEPVARSPESSVKEK